MASSPSSPAAAAAGVTKITIDAPASSTNKVPRQPSSAAADAFAGLSPRQSKKARTPDHQGTCARARTDAFRRFVLPLLMFDARSCLATRVRSFLTISPVARAFFAEEDGIPLPEISDTDHITLTSHPGTLRRRQRASRETSFPGL
jgi:hypothetical protein